MLEELYPKLRAVTFKYDLRRVGMIKDTIHTSVPDTLYACGYRLLNDRRYDEALRILDHYGDRNTVICLLSLGLDERALELLSAFPLSARTEYLKAIALVRLGRLDEATEHYDTACRLDGSLRYRSSLDPEIAELLRPGTATKQ